VTPPASHSARFAGAWSGAGGFGTARFSWPGVAGASPFGMVVTAAYGSTTP
jgi:hypothetical protein